MKILVFSNSLNKIKINININIEDKILKNRNKLEILKKRDMFQN